MGSIAGDFENRGITFNPHYHRIALSTHKISDLSWIANSEDEKWIGIIFQRSIRPRHQVVDLDGVLDGRGESTETINFCPTREVLDPNERHKAHIMFYRPILIDRGTIILVGGY